MKLEREALVILLLLAVVLAPTWYFAMISITPTHEVVLNGSAASIAPTERFLPTPAEVNEYVAGVITWIALFALVGMVYYTHQFIRVLSRSIESVPVDDRVHNALPPWLRTQKHQIAKYWPAQYSTPGMVGIVLVTWTTVVFAVLFGLEAFTYARTQYLGIYGGMMALALGVDIAIYATWFVPSTVVVEERGPGEPFVGSSPEADADRTDGERRTETPPRQVNE